MVVDESKKNINVCTRHTNFLTCQKAQAYLYSTNSGTEENCQAYVNLLKASWIMTDIIAAHPQVNFVSNGSQVVEMQHLSNVSCA